MGLTEIEELITDALERLWRDGLIGNVEYRRVQELVHSIVSRARLANASMINAEPRFMSQSDKEAMIDALLPASGVGAPEGTRSMIGDKGERPAPAPLPSEAAWRAFYLALGGTPWTDNFPPPAHMDLWHALCAAYSVEHAARLAQEWEAHRG